MPFSLKSCLPFARNSTQSFQFLDSAPLVDGELELVEPSLKNIDAVLASSNHPKSLELNAGLPDSSREQLRDFVDAFPRGRQNPGAASGGMPAYYFWMKITGHPELTIAGGIGLRVSHSYDVVMYVGHIGYHVYPAARGHHYAERATRLLLPLAARHALKPLWITCNPDNFASRRTCERLGGQLVEIVPVPVNHLLYQRGEHEKCRYRIDI